MHAWIGATLIAGVSMAASVRADDAASSQPAGPQAIDTPVKSLGDRVQGLDDRLRKLQPKNPRAYFELGEEVASESQNAAERRLAQQLFALSFDLSRQGTDAKQRTLRAGSLLALAAASGAPGERRWLLALAKTQSARPEENSQDDAEAATGGLEPGAIEAATALDMASNGEGRRAAKLLEKPGAAALLDRYDRLLDPNGMMGGAEHVRKIISTWPLCPECHNRRWVKDKDGVHLCPTCDGDPGPHLTRDELVAMLRGEAVMLNGEQWSWASQTLVDDGAPLRDLDLAEVAPTYGVEASRAMWKDGAWVSGTVGAAVPGGAGGVAGVTAGAGDDSGTPKPEPSNP